MTTSTLLFSVFLGVALVGFLAGLVQRGLRTRIWPMAIFAGAAALGARSDSFWAMASFALLALWCAILVMPSGDLGWRARFGFVLVVQALAFLVLWPTLHIASDGLFACPPYVLERVHSRLVAGLDIRGGLRLAYSVDVAEAVKDKRNAYYETMRRELSRLYAGHSGDDMPSEAILTKLKESVELEKPRGRNDALRLTVKEGADPAKIDTRFRAQFQPDLEMRKAGDRVFEFSIRDATESAIRERAVAQAKDIIHRRVDALGLREAAVSSSGEDIFVEVPGQDEAAFQEIRELISQTARLEFKMVDDGSRFFQELSQRSAGTTLPPGLEFRQERVPLGEDERGERIQGVATYARLPIAEGQRKEQCFVALREWAQSLNVPDDREVGIELERDLDEATLAEKEVGCRTFLLHGRAEITGDMIRDAVAMPDQGSAASSGWLVRLNFTDQGGRIFERVTGSNVGRRFAIILDSKIESAPVIQSRISGGTGVINMGSQDPEVQLRDSRKLELVLRSGALPAPISPTNEQRIGPSLGRDSIALGVQGAVGGSVLVLVFMILYYAGAGLIADIAVLLNLFLQLAILATFGASMTLPGIAGLALTLGMSVDANVLINERMREEVRDGKSPRAAVEVAYSKAFSAIVDGHVTTIIAGVILAQYGTGPVKGFAVTLIVGVLCSIFTGVMVTRVCFDFWVRNLGKKGKLSLG
jgi:preprotein translocase subunit SecD